MYFEEKLDTLKRIFSPADFKVPFTEGSNILKSIEKEFIIVKDLAIDLNNLSQRFNNWADSIKLKKEVRSVDLNNQSDWLDKLDANTNYWAVITDKRSSSFKHLVYDCKPNAIIALFSISQSDFFIVDKKYKWFSYFRVDRQTHLATIFKSGEKMTPFEF